MIDSIDTIGREAINAPRSVFCFPSSVTDKINTNDINNLIK